MSDATQREAFTPSRGPFRPRLHRNFSKALDVGALLGPQPRVHPGGRVPNPQPLPPSRSQTLVASLYGKGNAENAWGAKRAKGETAGSGGRQDASR